MPLSKKEKKTLVDAVNYFNDHGLSDTAAQIEWYIDFMNRPTPKDGELWEIKVSHAQNESAPIWDTYILATWCGDYEEFVLPYDYPVDELFESDLGLANVSIVPVKKVSDAA